MSARVTTGYGTAREFISDASIATGSVLNGNSPIIILDSGTSKRVGSLTVSFFPTASGAAAERHFKGRLLVVRGIIPIDELAIYDPLAEGTSNVTTIGASIAGNIVDLAALNIVWQADFYGIDGICQTFPFPGGGVLGTLDERLYIVATPIYNQAVALVTGVYSSGYLTISVVPHLEEESISANPFGKAR